MSRSTFRALILIFSMLWISGPAVHAAQSTPETIAPEATFSESECAYELPDGFVAGENAICGTVTAPLYYDRDTDETVTLPVIRLKSTAESPENPPLVILQGGPGETMRNMLAGFDGGISLYSPVVEQLVESQDVILFDQRGMGLSEPSMICPAERQMPGAIPEAEATPVDPGEQVFQQIQACKDGLEAEGLQFDAFNARNSAADVDAIRVALDLDEIDIFGVSWGSRLAMEFLRDYSPVVRVAILASPSPPERMAMMEEHYIGISDSLRLIFEGCENDPDCNAANPDLEENLELAFESLDAAPLPVPVQDPVTGEVFEMPMNGFGFAQLLQGALWSGPAIPMIPSLITTAAQGDSSVIEEVMAFQPTESASLGITITLFCQDVIPFRSLEDIQSGIEQADVLPFVASGAVIGVDAFLYPACELWDLEASDPVTIEPVSSDVPTLILSGRYDPITPPSHGEDLLETFPNAQHVVVEDASHGPSPVSGMCPTDLMAAFLADPEADLDTSCADTPVDFSPDTSPSTPVESAPEASPAG